MGTALARRTDLATSHQAASFISGIANKLENAVYEAIHKAGPRGLNWGEISDATGIDKASVSPRLKPLRKKLLIAPLVNSGVPVTRRHLSSRPQQVWVAAYLSTEALPGF